MRHIAQRRTAGTPLPTRELAAASTPPIHPTGVAGPGSTIPGRSGPSGHTDSHILAFALPAESQGLPIGELRVRALATHPAPIRCRRPRKASPAKLSETTDVSHNRDSHLTHTNQGRIAKQLYALINTGAPPGTRTPNPRKSVWMAATACLGATIRGGVGYRVAC